MNIAFINDIFIFKMRSIRYIFIIISAILIVGTGLKPVPTNAEENSDFTLGRKSFQDGFYAVAAK